MRRSIARRVLRIVALVAIALLLVEGALQGAALVVHRAGRSADTGWHSDGLRVLALGDSNTHGIYLDEDESYPSQLEALWNADPEPGPSIEVLNLGYPGNGTDSILADYRRSLEVLRPDVVLLLAGANDYWALPVERDAMGQATSSPVSFLAEHSRLYRLWRIAREAVGSEAKEAGGAPDFRDPELRLEIERRSIAEWLREKGGEVSPMVSDKRQHGGETFAFGFRANEAPAPSDETDRRLASNLRELHAISESSPAVVLSPTYPSNAGLYRLANLVIRTVARAQGRSVVDLAAVFAERCAGDPDCPELLLPDGHPTAQGYGVVAEVLRDEIRERVASGEIPSSR